MPTKTTNFCLRCEGQFESESELPKSCRLCHSALWNQPRKNKVGQGRKRKGYVKIEYIETPGMLEEAWAKIHGKNADVPAQVLEESK